MEYLSIVLYFCILVDLIVSEMIDRTWDLEWKIITA